MSILQTVAMATNNYKDNHFFFAIFQLFASFSRVIASVKYLETWQFCENDFGQITLIWKNKIYQEDS